MSITLGTSTRLIDDIMTNYSQWHTEWSPTGKKVNSVEEVSSLSENVDLIMCMLMKKDPIDTRDVTLYSLVAQEKEQVNVNFISRYNFNNTTNRSNFCSNNPRPFPSNNSYENSYNNTYLSTKSSTFQLENVLLIRM